MRDYVEALGEQLEAAARVQALAVNPHRDRPRIRRLASAVAAAAVAIGVVLLLVLAPNSPEPAFARFPVLERPITDASGLPIAPELRRDGADLRHARAFRSPHGTGYAIPTTSGGLCLAVPDGTGGYAATCAGPDSAEQHGVFVRVAAAAPPPGVAARVAFAVLLPADATAPTVESAKGGSHTLSIDRGVATGLLERGATVSYRIGGRVILIRLSEPFPVPTVAGGPCPGTRAHIRVLPGPNAGRTSC